MARAHTLAGASAVVRGGWSILWDTMFRITGSMAMNAPVASIWDRLIDFPGIPSWEGDVLEVRQISPGEPRVGTELILPRKH